MEKTPKKKSLQKIKLEVCYELLESYGVFNSTKKTIETVERIAKDRFNKQ